MKITTRVDEPETVLIPKDINVILGALQLLDIEANHMENALARANLQGMSHADLSNLMALLWSLRDRGCTLIPGPKEN